MPAWAAVIIGLGSGLVGTFASIIFQRFADRRSRRLNAASEFLTAADAFRRTVRGRQAATDDESIEAIQDAWDDLVPRLSLVRLLYGLNSPEAGYAGAATGAFRCAADVYEQGPPEVWSSDDSDSVDENMGHASTFVEFFTERAGGGPLRRLRVRQRVVGARLRAR